MAHLVEQMAYVGATPWHGLGTRLTQKQPLEVWQREAGMNWQIQDSPVHFKADTVGNLGTIHSFPEQKVLYRSDTKAPLSVVSNRYQVVQPREVLEFYRDLTEVSGYELETAGILKGGRKFWALARTGQTTALKGNDQVNGYLLLATSCDGTLYEGQGRGATLESAQGTAWGLLNAVTEYVDHERRARSTEYRMDSAWFGAGASLKERALNAALQLAA